MLINIGEFQYDSHMSTHSAVQYSALTVHCSIVQYSTLLH